MNYALLVGINKYAEFFNLRYPEADATALRDALLSEHGGVFLKRDVRLIVDAANKAQEPTFSNVIAALRTMCAGAQDGDLVLFYFAGHGFDAEGTSYLVTQDTSPRALEDTALRVNRVLEIMTQSSASRKVLLLDACRENADRCAPGDQSESARSGGEDEPRARTFGDDLKRAMDQQSKKPGWELISSCGPGQLAWEASSLGGGLWTRCFLARARGAKSEAPTVYSLFEQSHDDVIAWTKLNGKGEQTPYYRCNKPRESTVLFEPFPKETPSAATPGLMRAMAQRGVRVLIQKKDPEARGSSSDWNANDPRGERVENDGRFGVVPDWTPETDQPSAHLVPFESEVDRADLHTTRRDCNQRFEVRLYLPSLPSFPPPFPRLFLMFNGVGEADPTIYDDIGVELALRHGIPSVLMPMPGHFGRQNGFPAASDDPFVPLGETQMRLAIQRILQGILCQPAQMLHIYRQLLGDARQLIRTIRTGFDPLWSELFVRDTAVSLFGYSIGGFPALALMLLNPEHYCGAFLLESGAFFDKIDAGAIFRRHEGTQKLLWENYFVRREGLAPDEALFSLDEEEQDRAREFSQALSKDLDLETEYGGAPWRIFYRSGEKARETWHRIVMQLYEIAENDRQLLEVLEGREVRMFSRICLGHESLLYADQLAKNEQRVLFVTGGQDEVFRTSALPSPATGLTLLQIPGLGHWLKDRSRKSWLLWKSLFIDVMEAFARRLQERDRRA